MTQPTLLDLYQDEEFLTTPGVMQGLMQKASPDNPNYRIFDRGNGNEGVYYRSSAGMQYFLGDRPMVVAAAPEPQMENEQPGFGETSPSEFARGVFETGATVAKGTAQAVGGLFGDVESVFRGLLNNLDQPAMQRIQTSPAPFLRTFFELVQAGVDFDKFTEGMEQETILPTIKEVGEAIDRTGIMPQRQVMDEGAVDAAEFMGEMLAPSTYIQTPKKIAGAVKAGAKRVKKAVTKSESNNTIPASQQEAN